ncbi:MAG: hypothetical protein ACTSO9_16935 [Candidatus Helarchaeota archaeon]
MVKLTKLSDLLKNKKIWCVTLIIGVLIFVILISIAIHTYPVPYFFWSYYFSDLGRVYTDFGRFPNEVSSILYTIAVLSVAFTYIPFWIVLKSLFQDSNIKYLSILGTISGLLSSFFLILVAIFPTDTQKSIHGIVAMSYFSFFTLGILIFTIALFYTKKYPNIYVYINVLVLGFAIAYIFSPISRPFFQKLCVFSFIAWGIFQVINIWRNCY